MDEPPTVLVRLSAKLDLEVRLALDLQNQPPGIFLKLIVPYQIFLLSIHLNSGPLGQAVQENETWF